MRWLVMLGFVAACYQPSATPDCILTCGGEGSCPSGSRCGTSGLCSTSNTCPGDTPGDDAGSPDGGLGCFGTGLLTNLCVTEDDVDDLTLPEMIATDNGPCSEVRAQAAGPEVCVIRAKRSIVLVTRSRAIGSRALALVAPLIEIRGTLDLSNDGAGALNLVDGLQDGNTLTQNMTVSGAGGGGGSFAGKGGGGGETTGPLMVVAGAPAAPKTTSLPAVVIGGSNGGAGGLGDMSLPGGQSGLGGGAVYLAASTILVSGVIHANGGGGIGAQARSGGGAGGAGGLIALDAPTVVVSATGKLLAAGGGGASGGTASGPGIPGGEPDLTAMNAADVGASGGTSAGNGGRGGDGAIDETDADNGDVGPEENVGGGGGGGGVGFILLYTASPLVPGSLIVPAPKRP